MDDRTSVPVAVGGSVDVEVVVVGCLLLRFLIPPNRVGKYSDSLLWIDMGHFMVVRGR